MNKRGLKIGFASLIGAVTLGLGITAINTSSGFAFSKQSSADMYSVTLNSENKVTSNGSKTYKTALGNDINFTYSGVAGSTTGHVTLGNGGTIVNDNIIRSIDSFTVNFTSETANPITFKTAYATTKWSDSSILLSGQTYNLTASHPYFIQFTASASVTITSIHLTYTCVENPGWAEYVPGESSYQKVTSGNVEDGDYLIVYEYDEETARILPGNNVTNAANNFITASFDENGYIPSSTAVDNASFAYNATNKTFKNKDNKYLLNTGKKTIDTSDDSFSHTTVTVSSTTATIYGNSNYLRYNTSWPGFRYYDSASMGDIQLYKKVTSEGTYVPNTPTIPVAEIGFDATDSKNNYTEDDVFATSNGLVVRSLTSDSQYHVLASNQYTYVVKNSLDQTINHNQAFGAAGDYKVIVSYGTYDPVIINFAVGRNEKVTSLVKHFNLGSTVLNTSNKLSDFIGSALTIDIMHKYSDLDETGIVYSQFASKGLTLTLSTPSGVDYAHNAVFGVAGTWTITVTSADGPSVTQVFTVNAIPVQEITLNHSEYDLEEGDHLQLEVATLLPNDATNQNVIWSSDDSTVASVSETGYVTAVAVGETDIKATAADGSGIYGVCTITVNEKQVPIDEGEFTLVQSGNTLNVGDYVIIASGHANGSVNAAGLQQTNNRKGESATVSSNKITRDSNSAFYAFEIRSGTTAGTYSFYDTVNEKYLYASSSGSNLLQLESTLTANSSWTVSIGSGDATITAQGSNSRKLMRYNPNNASPIFACYATNTTTGNAPSLFTKSGIKPTSITISGSASVSTKTSQYSVASWEPSNIAKPTVTWTSSNTNVATISSSGLLTAVAAGQTTITASCQGQSGTISDSITVTVSYTSVTGVTLNKSQMNLTVGEGTDTLVATIAPASATNKSVNWSSSNTSVATVSNGVVTPVAAGSATITVTSVDDNTKTATCVVTVASSGGGGGGSGGGATDVLTNSNTINQTTTDYSSWTTSVMTSGAVYAGQSAGGNGTIQLRSNNSNSGIVTTTSGGSIYKITVVWNGGTASGRVLNVYGKNSAYSSPSDLYGSSSGTSLGTIVYGTSTELTINGDYEYVGVRSDSGALYMDSISFQWGEEEPVYPTAISFTKASEEVSLGGTKDLTKLVNFTNPSGTVNQKILTWHSSDSSIVDVGEHTGVAEGISEGTTTVSVTASKDENGTQTSPISISITVVETESWTIMIYMCGSDLESGNGFASSDITEILSVEGQPSNVNIIIETGGSTSWHGNYGIRTDKLQRWHVRDQELVLDATLNKANMSTSSTFQSFLTWGLTTPDYQADKYGVILWDHGGALEGCCWDDNYNTGYLTPDQAENAFSNALGDKKLEWVGYDCCLMQVQDIAEFNSHHFNYMVASQESEAGEGWDYDTWVDNLYNNDSTTDILTAIVDGFIAATDELYEKENYGPSDQTLSYLDLSYMSAYLSAWQALATALSTPISTYGASSFISLLKNYVAYFGSSWVTASERNEYINSYGYVSSDFTTYEDGYYFLPGYVDSGTFDVLGFLNKILTINTFKNAAQTQINNVKSAFNNLIGYNKVGAGVTGEANGLCFFFRVNKRNASKSDYSNKLTNFTNWASIVNSYGVNN